MLAFSTGPRTKDGLDASTAENARWPSKDSRALACASSGRTPELVELWQEAGEDGSPRASSMTGQIG